MSEVLRTDKSDKHHVLFYLVVRFLRNSPWMEYPFTILSKSKLPSEFLRFWCFGPLRLRFGVPSLSPEVSKRLFSPWGISSVIGPILQQQNCHNSC